MSIIKTGGRPTKELGEKRTYMVSVKMSTGEYYSLKTKAKKRVSAGVNIYVIAYLGVLSKNV